MKLLLEKGQHLLAVAVIGTFIFASIAFITQFDLSRFPIARSDEMHYLNAGLQRMGEQWNIYSFPVHSLAYAITGLFEANPVRNYQFNAFAPFFLMVFLLQLHVLRCTRSLFSAILVAAPLLLAPEMGITAWPHTNQTVCIIFLAGMLTLPAEPSWSRITHHFIILYFLMAFARSEQILALYLMLVLVGSWAFFSFFQLKNWHIWRLKIGWVLLSAGVLISALSFLMGKPILLDKYRSLAAFSQHFAYSLSLRSDLAEHPWTQSPIVFERYFGEATSISQAMFNNPSIFLNHVLSNCTQFIKWAVQSDPIGAVGWTLAFVFYAVSLVGLLFKILRDRRSDSVRDERFGSLVIGIAPLPSLLLLLLIFPRANYLQMSYVLLVASSAAIAAPLTLPRLMPIKASLGATGVVAIIMLTLLQPLDKKTDPVVAVIRTLEKDIRTQQYDTLRIASSDILCGFIAQPCEHVSVGHGVEKLVAGLQNGPVDYLVIGKHPELEDNLDERIDHLRQLKEADTWQSLPAPQGWKILRKTN